MNRLSRQRIKVILLNRRGLLKDGLGLKFRRDQSRTLIRILLRDVSADSPALVQDEAVVLLQPRCHFMIRMSMTMNEIETHNIRNLAERLVLQKLRRLMLTTREIDGVEFKGDVLLV